ECTLPSISYLHLLIRGGYAEDLPHRLERARELLPFARETETEIAFSVRAEIDPRHAPDPAVSNEVFRHPPRDRFPVTCGRPLWIDAQERVEGAPWRIAAEDAAERPDAVVEKVPPCLQLDGELPDARLR